MRDYRDAKTMAKGLRRSLADIGTGITHSQSLELIAQAFGFDNWNILAAKIEAARPAPATEKSLSDTPLKCAFCGKPKHDVKLLIAGPGTSICSECVALCDGVVEDNEVERHVRDLTPDVDPAAALEGRTAEQLAAYLARAERRIAESRQTLESLDGDPQDLPSWLQARDAPERATVQATLARQVALWTRSTQIVARVLAART
ncbi:MAG: ClpX C4-type zinc finger protein [Caulobacteraceae bacterium]